MRALSVVELLHLPVRLHGIELARPTDLLLDVADRRAVGFVVLCGDGSERFLPYPAAKIRDGELAVGSPLMLLSETAFYRARARSFRDVIGSEVDGGVVRDLLVVPHGDVEFVLEAPALAADRAA